MEVQLKVLVGNNVGQVLKVPGPKFFVGRAEDCHLRPGSDLVSRHHCVLMLEGSTLVIRDFGSKNGTYVNGERVTSELALQQGDQLKIGPLEFEVQMAESLTGAKRPKVTSVKEAAVRTAESGVHEDIDIDALLNSGVPAEQGDTRELRRGDTQELEVSGTDTAITPKPIAAPAAGAGPCTVGGRAGSPCETDRGAQGHRQSRPAGQEDRSRQQGRRGRNAQTPAPPLKA